MPAQVLNGPAVATHMYQALFGKAPSNALYNSYIAQIGTTDGAAFAASLTTGFATTTDAALATLVLANLGVTATTMPATAAVAGVTAVPAVAATATTPAVAAVAGVTAVAAVTSAQAYAALESALTQMFTGYGVSARGQIILNMTNLLANLEGDKTFGTIATTYNNQTLSNFTYASNAANTVAAAVTVVDPVTAGQTYTLTTGIDNFTGASGNDTFIADDAALSAADTVNGGAGTDTFKVYGLSAAKALTMPTITSVEKLYLSGAAASLIYDASTNAGITSVELDAQLGTAASVKVTTGQAVALSNNTAATFTTTISGNTPTSLGLTLNNIGNTAGTVDTVDFSGTALTTLNITGSTTKSSASLTNTGAKISTINVDGAANVTLIENGAMSTAVKTINAGTATGNVSVDTSLGAKNLAFAFTGGAGNDTLKLAAGDLAILTSGAQLDGGAGTGDKLTTLDTTFTAADYAKINATKGFEVLGTGAAAAVVDASKLTTIKGFSVDGDGIQAYSNLVTGSSVAVTAAHAATLGIAGGVGVQDLVLTIGTATTTGFAIGGNLTIGQTSVALSSNGTNAAANSIATLKNADSSTYTITGSNDLTISSTQATTTGTKFDATAFTGKLNVTGSQVSDILIGGSGADTLKGGATTYGVTAVTAVTEVATMTGASGLTAGQIYTVAGLTFTSTGVTTQAELLTAFASLAVGATTGGGAALGTYTGTLAGYSTSAVAANVVTFTSTTAAAVADLVDSGTGAAAAVIAVTTQGVDATTAVVQSNDLLTGNAGADTFVFSQGANGSAVTGATATITDFVTGVDKLKMTVNGAGTTANYLEAASAVADLATVMTAAHAAFAGTTTYYVGQVGSDSYLVTKGTGATFDTDVIKLTGVALTAIAQGDIIA